MKDALSTVVVDEFCLITCSQMGTSLSGSTMSSTVQARSEKRMSQESTCSEKIVQNQRMVNPQQEEEKSSDDRHIFNHFEKIKEKVTELLKNCF